MDKYNAVIVRPGEFMVRQGSPVRKYMLSRLVESIEKKLRWYNINYSELLLKNTRIIINEPENPVKVSYIISRIFGVSSTSPALIISDPVLDDVYYAVKQFIREKKPHSLALRIRGFINGLTEREVLYAITALISSRLNIFFNLVNPELEVIIEGYGDKVAVMDQVVKGVGGLPYGVEGCLVVLVSGGVDSALAAWKTMKRGVRIIPVFIDYGEYWGVKARKRVEVMFNKLLEWVPWDHLKIYRLKGYEKLLLSTNIPSRLRCLFCKANMYRVAKYIADEEGCKGIATGEAIGQVASQTLSNLWVISRLVDTPIYRPLGFMDKLEIIEEARRLGFSELNIRVEPCRLKPENPETAATSRDYELLRKALEDTEEDARRIYEEYREVIILR